jgi:hydroxymethylglutaryl-CoA lyase
MEFPEKVRICEDVTRDGFQSTDRIISVEDKLALLDMIEDAGVKCIEVGAFSSYDSMSKMRNTKDVFKKLKQKPDIQYRAIVFAPDGVQEAADCGCRKVKINVSASQEHHKAGTGSSPKEAMARFAECAKIANANGMELCGSISLPFISPFEGVIPMDTLKGIIHSFIDIGITEISLSDAAGLGNPKMIYQRSMEVRKIFPQVSWMLHMHNTQGMGLAGVTAAMCAGIAKLDSSLAGLGGCPYIEGATGNVATEDLVSMLNGMGIETGIDLKKLIIAGQFVEKLVDGKGTDSYIQRIERRTAKS